MLCLVAFVNRSLLCATLILGTGVQKYLYVLRYSTERNYRSLKAYKLNIDKIRGKRRRTERDIGTWEFINSASLFIDAGNNDYRLKFIFLF